MVLDVETAFKNGFIAFFDSVFCIVPIVLIVSIAIFIFRIEIAYEFNLDRIEQKKLYTNSLMLIIISIGITIFYLYLKEYFFLLLSILSTILMYFLYVSGVLGMFFEKLEDRYGRTKKV